MSANTIDTATHLIGEEAKGGVLSAIAGFYSAMTRGMRAANEYNALVARGVAPEVACRSALNIIDKH